MLKQVDRTKSVKGWNNRTFFPKDNYIIRCVSGKFAPNANGNPMVTLEWEIVNQSAKQIGDDLVEFDGVKFPSYHVLRVNGEDGKLDEESTNKAFNRYVELLNLCGMDVSEGVDDENPVMPKGKVVHATLFGKDQPSYASPTPEELVINPRARVGKPIKDPITGKDVINYQIGIDTIYGPFEGQVARPF